MVECGGLENRCPPSGGPGVRIPFSPPSLAIALLQEGDGEFIIGATADAVRKALIKNNPKGSFKLCKAPQWGSTLLITTTVGAEHRNN